MRRDHARLLVVDDAVPVRELIRELLEDAGFIEVDEAADGALALEMMRSAPYDLIITDWNMPELNGLELVKRIRQWPERWHIPVLVISASIPEGAIEAGANGVLTKPFSAASLVAEVLGLVGQIPVTSHDVG